MEKQPKHKYLYLKEILEKYDFINKLFITDCDGNLICPYYQQSSEEEDLDQKKLKNHLFSTYNFAISQFDSLEKINNKGITSMYDNMIVYQTKIDNSIFIHIFCDINHYNHSIIKDICNELTSRK